MDLRRGQLIRNVTEENDASCGRQELKNEVHFPTEWKVKGILE